MEFMCKLPDGIRTTFNSYCPQMQVDYGKKIFKIMIWTNGIEGVDHVCYDVEKQRDNILEGLDRFVRNQLHGEKNFAAIFVFPDRISQEKWDELHQID